MSPFKFIIHNRRDRFISEGIEKYGVWEPFETSLARKLMFQTQSRFVLNIGANIGWYAVIAGLTLPEGKVVAVEPAPDNFALLRDSVIINNLQNVVEPLNIALSDRCGEAQLFLCEDNRGDHRLNYHQDDRTSVSVPVSTIDTLAEGWKYLPDILIMDTQGSDGLILRGAQATFNKGWNPVALFEFWPAELKSTGVDPVSLFDFYEERGYIMYHIGGKGTIARIQRTAITEWVGRMGEQDYEAFIDILAIPEKYSHITL